MRCVIVNGAQLKAEASCAHCGRKIGEGYVRDVRRPRRSTAISTCYRVAVGTPLVAFEQRATVPDGWMRQLMKVRCDYCRGKLGLIGSPLLAYAILLLGLRARLRAAVG